MYLCLLERRAGIFIIVIQEDDKMIRIIQFIEEILHSLSEI
jgi:hypothetical protein